MKMYFEADATGNYLRNEDSSISARCDVPEGASEDYGYNTMKRAIIKALEAADIEIDIEWWYGEADQLEADADADCQVDVDIDLDEEGFEKDGRCYHFRNKDEWEAIVSYMDDEIREAVHSEMSPCTNEAFLRKYLEKDPDFEDLLWTEFSIRYNG